MDDNELISVCNNLKQLQKVMIEINDVVEGMTDTNLKEKMSKMSYLESAQMHLVMAEISINMFYAYLKSKGVDVSEHPIQKEMKRLEEYKKKMNEVLHGREMPTMRIDKEATARIIQNSIGQQ
ncbi:hypothetical protein JH06_2815 [Blastocystis sp. subtype 4]|uniref:hypothetical protein n=1 Tax=Blastocystis sp. subtype 4 TaxID=944170 RepID=UPI00071165D7|nr:hypothetical protein JH06_2815 [Blastocystis sp. subtype 4]KNB44522.1 hypothetical protein JH06_2815 [Blastocystis sp. subtype 4]|eukprot:XP_014527958.1 hypothetical protein JH06_2815 [Blastocystis sp. subtype 4]